MKRLTILFSLLMLAAAASAQKYMTRDGFISFYSHTPVEDIKGDNNQVASVLDASNGDLVFQVLVKSFHFDRALMEEHFNENYMESDKYPKSVFKGKITDLKNVDFNKPGSYKVKVSGDLTIHNVTKPVTADGTLDVTKEGINASSKFSVDPEDYKINIPGVVRDKINKNLEVTVSMKYTPLNN